MSASRETHDTYIVGIDSPCLGRVANDADSLLGITHRDGAVTARHPVSHNEESYALTIEPFCPVMALMVNGQMGITTTRQIDDGTSRRILGQIADHIGLTIGRDVHGKLTSCLCLQ